MVTSFKESFAGPAFVVPSSHEKQSTSSLLTNGLVVDLLYPGIPVYSPLGTAALQHLEDQLQAALRRCGYHQIQLPTVMSDADLYAGQSVGSLFASKLLTLASLPGYHLLSTPEMMLLRASRRLLRSHRDLPVRRSYTSSFFRRARGIKALLVCREFRIVGTSSLEARDDARVHDALNAVVTACVDVLNTLGVRTIEIDDSAPTRIELAYPTDEGDLWATTGDSRIRALSLAIGYEYSAGTRLPLRYRTMHNRNASPRMTTFGLCTNRTLHCVFDACRDSSGFALPRSIRPYDTVVIPRSPAAATKAAALANSLESACLRVGLDDRWSIRPRDREAFAHYLGAEVAVIVSETEITSRPRLGRVNNPLAATMVGTVDTVAEQIART